MAKVFNKWVCPSPKCRRWYRKPGTCKCGTELVERNEYSVDYRDGDAKRRVEDLDTTSKRVAERELAIRVGEASNGKSRPQRRTLVSICQEYMETKSKIKGWKLNKMETGFQYKPLKTRYYSLVGVTGIEPVAPAV